jgi:hypothetical protein
VSHYLNDGPSRTYRRSEMIPRFYSKGSVDV